MPVSTEILGLESVQRRESRLALHQRKGDMSFHLKVEDFYEFATVKSTRVKAFNYLIASSNCTGMFIMDFNLFLFIINLPVFAREFSHRANLQTSFQVAFFLIYYYIFIRTYRYPCRVLRTRKKIAFHVF